MFTKTLLALTAALVVTTSLASAANAQRVPRPEHQAVQPFTDAERNWFDTATGRDDGMPRH
jgi:hypothetical protein